eukprot:9368720-Alexandrium_andersonii.AAC.1
MGAATWAWAEAPRVQRSSWQRFVLPTLPFLMGADYAPGDIATNLPAVYAPTAPDNTLQWLTVLLGILTVCLLLLHVIKQIMLMRMRVE